MQNPLRSLFERRSIGSSHDLWQYLARGVTSSSGATVNENSAMNVAVVRQCVALISRTIMTLPVDVRERTSSGSRPAGDAHPLVRLFDNPNTWQDWPMFVQMMQVHLLLRANAYAWVNWVKLGAEKDKWVAKEIIPLHPDRVTVEQLADWSLAYTLTRKNGTKVPLPADEVMHLRGLSTDGYMGRQPLVDLRESVGDSLSAQRFSSNFWGKNATPPLALKHKGVLSAAARKNLEDSWEATYGGPNGKRVAVVEEGMEIEQLAFNAEQSQFLETRKFLRSELAGEFFVPPHMIGDTEKSTSWGTGIEQQKLGYLTFTIQPWLTVWEHGIRRALIVNPARFYVKFKVEGLLRGDSAARADFYERMWRMGAYSINQILALEDMNPVEGGDVRFVPLNYVPLDRAISGDVDAQSRQAGLMSELLDRLRAEKAA